MIRINLLPWRAELRNKTKKQFIKILIGSGVLIIAIIIALHFVLQQAINNQQARNQYLQQQSDRYNQDIQQIRKLRNLQKELNNRRNVIQAIQDQRPYIVHLFETFSNTIPDGIYYSKITRNKENIIINGRADANSQISQLMRNIKQSPWVDAPALSVIKANQTQNNYKRDFDLRLKEKH